MTRVDETPTCGEPDAAHDSRIRVVTLNLQHGGGDRVAKLCAALASYEADVLVLSEYRTGPTGARISAALRASGFTVLCDGGPPPKTNSVLVAAKSGRALDLPLDSASPHRHRVAEVDVGAFVVGGVYFPGNQIKARFWRDEFLALAATRVERPYLFIGDFNTGKHRIDEAGATFVSPESIDAMERMGWTDPWRARNPTAREFTWYSGQGNGFRLDHAYVSGALAPSVTKAWHDQTPRTNGVTDHAALVVEVAAAAWRFEDRAAAPRA